MSQTTTSANIAFQQKQQVHNPSKNDDDDDDQQQQQEPSPLTTAKTNAAATPSTDQNNNKNNNDVVETLLKLSPDDLFQRLKAQNVEDSVLFLLREKNIDGEKFFSRGFVSFFFTDELKYSHNIFPQRTIEARNKLMKNNITTTPTGRSNNSGGGDCFVPSRDVAIDELVKALSQIDSTFYSAEIDKATTAVSVTKVVAKIYPIIANVVGGAMKSLKEIPGCVGQIASVLSQVLSTLKYIDGGAKKQCISLLRDISRYLKTNVRHYLNPPRNYAHLFKELIVILDDAFLLVAKSMPGADKVDETLWRQVEVLRARIGGSKSSFEEIGKRLEKLKQDINNAETSGTNASIQKMERVGIKTFSQLVEEEALKASFETSYDSKESVLKEIHEGVDSGPDRIESCGASYRKKFALKIAGKEHLLEDLFIDLKAVPSVDDNANDSSSSHNTNNNNNNNNSEGTTTTSSKDEASSSSSPAAAANAASTRSAAANSLPAGKKSFAASNNNSKINTGNLHEYLWEREHKTSTNDPPSGEKVASRLKIIIGQAGVGKTCFAQREAQRQHFKDAIVIFVPLKQLIDKGRIDSIIDLFDDLDVPEVVKKHKYRILYYKIPVVFILDGFDEVIQSLDGSVQDFLKNFLDPQTRYLNMKNNEFKFLVRPCDSLILTSRDNIRDSKLVTFDRSGRRRENHELVKHWNSIRPDFWELRPWDEVTTKAYLKLFFEEHERKLKRDNNTKSSSVFANAKNSTLGGGTNNNSSSPSSASASASIFTEKKQNEILKASQHKQMEGFHGVPLFVNLLCETVAVEPQLDLGLVSAPFLYRESLKKAFAADWSARIQPYLRSSSDPDVINLSSDENKDRCFAKVVEQVAKIAFEEVLSHKGQATYFVHPRDEKLCLGLEILRRMNFLLDDSTDATRFRFKHRTFIEFLAAKYIDLHPKETLDRKLLPFSADYEIIWILLCQLAVLRQNDEAALGFFGKIKKKIMDPGISVKQLAAEIAQHAYDLYRRFSVEERRTAKTEVMNDLSQQIHTKLLVQAAMLLPNGLVLDALKSCHTKFILTRAPSQFRFMVRWCGEVGATSVLNWLQDFRFREDILTPELCAEALCRAFQAQSSSTSDAFESTIDFLSSRAKDFTIYDAIRMESPIALARALAKMREQQQQQQLLQRATPKKEIVKMLILCLRKVKAVPDLLVRLFESPLLVSKTDYEELSNDTSFLTIMRYAVSWLPRDTEVVMKEESVESTRGEKRKEKTKVTKCVLDHLQHCSRSKNKDRDQKEEGKPAAASSSSSTGVKSKAVGGLLNRKTKLGLTTNTEKSTAPAAAAPNSNNNSVIITLRFIDFLDEAQQTHYFHAKLPYLQVDDYQHSDIADVFENLQYLVVSSQSAASEPGATTIASVIDYWNTVELFVSPFVKEDDCLVVIGYTREFLELVYDLAAAVQRFIFALLETIERLYRKTLRTGILHEKPVLMQNAASALTNTTGEFQSFFFDFISALFSSSSSSTSNIITLENANGVATELSGFLKNLKDCEFQFIETTSAIYENALTPLNSVCQKLLDWRKKIGLVKKQNQSTASFVLC